MTTHHDYDADGTISDEMLDMQENERERDRLGQMVRDVWIAWAKEQPEPKASWLIPYNQLSEPDKEVDRRIGEKLFFEGYKKRFADQGYRAPEK